MKAKILRRMMMVMVLLGALVGLLSTGAFAAETVDSGTCGDNLTWTLDSDGVMTIAGSGEMEESYSWQTYKDSISSVIISDGVTSVGGSAFCNYPYLADVTLGDNVRSIGSKAFYGCTVLSGVHIPKSVRYIGAGAFSGCTSLNKIMIPDGVTDIWYNTFSDCTSLSEITIPDSVFNIASEAFSGCTSLREITLPSSVTSIKSGVFSGCTSLNEIMIPDGVTEIWYNAFSDCTSLSEITIPGSVTSIGQGAFSGCTSLIKATILDGVTNINWDVFSNCTSLSEITIPGSVTSIGSGAFLGCTSLREISIPENVTSIDSNTFSGCSALSEIVIEKSVKSIKDSAFKNCDKLSNVYYCGSSGDWHKVYVGTNNTSLLNAQFTYNYCVHKLVKVDAKDAICAEPGYVAHWKCGKCGALFNDADGEQETTMEKLTVTVPHTLTKTDEVPSTCTETGVNAYWTCSVCGKIFLDAEGKQETDEDGLVMKEKPHILSKTEEVSATCTKTGRAAYWTCDVCGKIFADENGTQETTLDGLTIPKAAHKLTKTEEVSATCTKTGRAAYWTCSKCGKIFADENGTQETTMDALTIPKAAHKLTKTEAKEPTKSETGNKEYWTCGVCGKLFADENGTQETTLEDMTLPKAESEISWTVENGVLVISGKGAMEDYSGTDMPWYDSRQKISKIVILDGVQYVGKMAFSECGSVKTVYIAPSVTEIAFRAFSGCTKLTTVYYGGSEEAWKNVSVDSTKWDSNWYIQNKPKVYNSAAYTLYIDENGTEQKCYIPEKLTADTTYPSGWYLVQGNVTIESSLKMSSLSLILADGATLTINGCESSGWSYDLNIYGQAGGSGKLISTDTINTKNCGIYGGTVEVTGKGAYAKGIYASENLTIRRAKVTATSTGYTGLNAIQTLEIVNSEVTATGETGIDTGTLTMQNATVVATGSSKGQGVKIGSTINLDNSKLTATGGCGASGTSMTLNLENSEVIASGNPGISARYLTIRGGKVTATGTDKDGIGISVGVSGKLDIENAEVTATGSDGTVTCGAKVEGSVRIVNSTASFIGGKLTASSSTAASIGLKVIGDVTTSNSKLTFGGGEIGNYSGKSRGLYVERGSVSIEGGTLHAYSSKGDSSDALIGIHLAKESTEHEISFTGNVEATLEGGNTGLLAASSNASFSDTAKVNITGGIVGMKAVNMSVTDSAAVNVTSHRSSLGSSGIMLTRLAVYGGSLNVVTADSKQTSDSKQASMGIVTESFSVFGGTVNVKVGSGNNVGVYVRGEDGNVARILGGKVTINAGAATVAKQCSMGISVPNVMLTVTGGSLTANAGSVDATGATSFGVFAKLVVGAGSVTASGATSALYSAPHLDMYGSYYWRTNAGANYTASSSKAYTFDKSQTYVELTKKLPSGFVDVFPGKYYTDAVSWAVANEITNGTSATTFSPNNACNRGQIVVFLWRLAGKPIAQNRNNPFTDVKEGSFCYEAVLWAAEQGITTGKTATTFCPAETCNRGQIVTFLWRYAGKPAPQNQNRQFVDVASGSFCDQAVMWAVENQITLGVDATHFNPTGKCTRGHAVTFLYRGRELLKK